MTLLKRFSSARSDRFRAGPPMPDTPFYAIGDVHGRYDLLHPLLDRLSEEPHPIVLVGDYVDRGDESASMLRHLHQAMASGQVICLRGNHEEMMLKFLGRPRKHGRMWLRFGGLQTLASFGIGNLTEEPGPDQLLSARDALVDAMGDLRDWLASLPYHWQSGNVAVVHAGADPRLPIGAQSQPALAWGHPDFHVQPRDDGVWVIHGHTIVADPAIEQGRAAIDTGAYATGRLTAVKVADGQITPV